MRSAGARFLRPLHLELERAEREPGRREVRIALGQHLDLGRRLGEALRRRQRPHVEQAHRRAVRPRRELALDDRLGLGRRRQHVEGEEGRAFGAGIGVARAAREGERLGRIAGGEPGAPAGDERRRLGVGRVGERPQGALDERRGGVAIGRAREQAGHRFDQHRQRRPRRLAQQRRERLFDVGDAIERDEQLDLVAQGVGRLGQRLAPGERGRERLVAGARLQRDLGGAPEQLLVLAALGGVEHELVGGADLAVAQLDLAEQQLVEERRVEVGVLDLARGRLGRDGRADGGGQRDERQHEDRPAARGGSDAKRRHERLLRRTMILVRGARRSPVRGRGRTVSERAISADRDNSP